MNLYTLAIGKGERTAKPSRKLTGSPAPTTALTSGVTSPATSSAEHGSAEQCPLADPSEARDALGRGWAGKQSVCPRFPKEGKVIAV